ncbi:VOC family protein [Roseicyclus sp.]|uniref:VOC family protein n=1 Tax=Roseicyclus sp. TaxID=1914329 RepID=UPI003F69AE2A
MTPETQKTSGARIGHVHLKVADLARSVAFYQAALGLEVQQYFGTEAAFLSFDGYHHHLGLNTWHSARGPRPAPNATGLYHTAFLYPDRAALGRALRRAIDAGVRLEGAADHGVSEAVYFSDPDGNGIELYWDRAPQDWPRDKAGQLAMGNAGLDPAALLALA